jgi:hypothetical protein
MVAYSGEEWGERRKIPSGLDGDRVKIVYYLYLLT